MLCFGHVAAYFLSKRFYILDTCIIFHEIMFFKELSAFIVLYFLQGAFILFRALYFIHGAFILFRALYFIHGAFILFRALYFSCIAPFYSCIALYSDFCVSQHLYIISNCESAALFHFPSKLSSSYYFNFLMWSAYLMISEWDFWWLCVSTSILILYKTFRFWPLV